MLRSKKIHYKKSISVKKVRSEKNAFLADHDLVVKEFFLLGPIFITYCKTKSGILLVKLFL